jgi:hypothetical protein
MRSVDALKHILPVKVTLIVRLFFFQQSACTRNPVLIFFFAQERKALQANPKNVFSQRSDFNIFLCSERMRSIERFKKTLSSPTM